MNISLKTKYKLNSLFIFLIESLSKLFLIKNIRDDFTVTPNPFNQNLNYEKILRFSITKVNVFFYFVNNLSKMFYVFEVKNC
jgi:hypothetical protein